MNILLCVTGSVAASVTEKVVEALKEVGEVKVAATTNATKFMNLVEIDLGFSRHAFVGGTKIIEDRDELNNWDYREEVLHIDLKNWADVIVVAPLSANTLAKLAVGMCDNLVTSIIRAYPVNKPIVIAPAMNTNMWNHPATHDGLDIIENRYTNISVAWPVKKVLACGDEGIGAMADAKTISKLVTQ